MPEDTDVRETPGEPEAGADSASDSAVEPKKRKFGCAGCLTVLLGLIVITALFGVWWFHRLGVERDEYCREVDARVQDALDAMPRVQFEDDAAPLYATAFGLYVAPADKNLARLRDIDKAKPGGLAKYVADNRAFIAALKKALAKPKYGRRADLTAGLGARLPNMQNFRNAARFLAVAAVGEARAGRPAEALKLLEISLRIARDANTDGVMIPRMVQIACGSLAAQGLERVLQESDPGEAELRRFLKKLDEYTAARMSMADVLRNDRLWMTIIMKQVVSGEQSLGSMSGVGGPGTPHPAEVLWRGSGAALRETRYYERAAGRLIAAAELPFPTCIEELNKVAARIDRDVNARDLKGFWNAKPMTAMLFPAYGRIMVSEGRGIARLRLMRLGIGCRLYRLRNGTYPAKLSELSSAFPREFGKLRADPFTGKDVKYQRTKTGCKLWSVGRNGVDNGGVKRTNTNRNACDIVFELTK